MVRWSLWSSNASWIYIYDIGGGGQAPGDGAATIEEGYEAPAGAEPPIIIFGP